MDLNELKKRLSVAIENPQFSSTPTTKNPVDWDSLIDKYSEQYPDVPKNIIKGILEQESGGDSNATGKETKYGTAKGPFQFIDSTAQQYIPGWKSPEDSYDPEKATAGAFNYVSALLKETGGDVKKAVGRYFGTGYDPVAKMDTNDYAGQVIEKSQKYNDSGTPFVAKEQSVRNNTGFDMEGLKGRLRSAIAGGKTLESYQPPVNVVPQQQPVMQPITGMQQPEELQVEPEQQKGQLGKVIGPLWEGGKDVVRNLVNYARSYSEKGKSNWESLKPQIEKEKQFAEKRVEIFKQIVEREPYNEDAKKKLKEYENQLKGSNNLLANAEGFIKQFSKEAEGFKGVTEGSLKAGEYKQAETGVGKFFQEVARGAPQVIGTAATYAMGGAPISTLSMFAQIAGGKYEELEKEGVDLDRAFAAGLASAAAQAPIEILPIADLVKGIGTKSVKKIAGSAIEEFITETIQNYPDAIAEIWAKTEGKSFEERKAIFFKDLKTITLDGLKQGAVAAVTSVLLGGAGAGANKALEVYDNNKTKKQQSKEQAQLKPIQDKLNADPDFQRAMNAPDLTGTMQPIVQGVKERYLSEVEKGKEEIKLPDEYYSDLKKKIQEMQQQPEVETPEGLKPEPEMKPIVQQPEEDTGPQQVDATEEQINVGKTLAVNNGKVVFQKSSWGMKATNPNTGEKVDIKPKFEFKDKETNGNITMSLDEISSPDAENILETKILEQRKAFEEGEKFRKEKGLTPTSELDAQDKASKLKKEKLNAEAIKKEDSNEKSVRVDEGVSKRKGETNKGERVEVSDISNGIDDVPSVQPVTEKQEESTVSPESEPDSPYEPMLIKLIDKLVNEGKNEDEIIKKVQPFTKNISTFDLNDIVYPRIKQKITDRDRNVNPENVGKTEKQEESTVSPAIERPEEHKAEIEAINTNPTEPQKEAGNYRKAHIKRDGMDISIENAAGQERKGTDKAGKEWKVTMNHDYGYIRGTKGADAYRGRGTDQLDVFIKPDAPEGGDVFVINQKDPTTGKFDEHKALIGFANKIEAAKAYKSNYEKGWKGLKSVVRMPMDQFKKWAYSEDTKNELTQEIADKYKTEQTGVTKNKLEDTNNIKEKANEKETSKKTETVLNEKVETPSLENEVLNRIKITDRHRNDVEKYSKAEFAKLYSNEVKSEVAKAFIDSTPEIGYDKTFDNAVSYEGTIGIAKNLYDKIKAEKDTDKVGSPSSDPNTQLVNDYVQLIKTHHGNKEKIPNTRKILDLADKAHGGTIAEGKYGIRDAYDALETAMNKYVEEIGLDEDPKETIKKLNNAIKVLPTQTVRTEDQVEKQQFSTPPSEAYLAVMASGIKEGMTGLEPSAGDGNIATIMRLANKSKGEIYTNEIDERRRNNLKILGFNPTDVDAEYLHSTLPENVNPDVVVMNPPFSATGGRLKSHNTGFGAEHVRQALLRLKDGGRLVAIVGNGMAFGKPKMAAWWSKVQKEYNVRANIGISGKEYEKYGTGFDNNIIVIDKTGPTENIETAITGEGLTVEQGYDKLEPLMKEDVYGRIKGNVSESGKKLDEEKPEGSIRGETADNAGDGSPGGSGRGTATDKGSGAKSKPVEGMGEPVSGVSGTAGKSDTGNNEPGKTGGSDTENGQRTDEKLLSESGNNDVGRTGGEQERVRLKKAKSSGIEEESGGVYAKYKVKKALYEGAVPHPANISESVTMASIELPDVTYKLSLPKKLMTSGALSDAQLEAVTYACQAHEQMLPNGMRKEYLIGDGTGMGKARTLLGIIYENSLKGRKKFVYITKSKGLINQLKGDMEAMGINIPVIPLDKFKKGEQIDASEGILFGTYSTVSGDFSSKKDRYNQVLNWFGRDNDSVFVFDESHLMKNVSESWTPWGSEEEDIKQLGEGSQRGQMGVQFKKDLPNARFVNASATAATEPVNLAYLTRLGLWGEGTPFKDFVAFLNTMRDGGVGAMELLARDMKANGLYLARSISYDGVNYETLNHSLSSDEKMVYNDMADFWSEILVKMEEAAANANMKKESQRIMKQFYAAQQRFFLQLMMSFQAETMIKDADKKLGEGKSVVISLFNTNEQQTDKKVSEAIDNGIDIDSIDFSPKDSMKQMIENNFPIYQYEEYTDEDGTKRTRQVLDKNGEPLINKENLDAMRKLVDKIENFRTPENPIDRIVNHFGFEKVAEITGRKKRIVMVNGRKEYRDRAIKGVAQKNINTHELKQFMDGDKRVAIISGAAATGFDLHASLKQKNKQRRVFYALQLSWSADEQMQSFGRVHRTMQASAPEIVLVKTDVASQQRLINTIQSKLASLGAISKGERESLSGGIFSIEDITDSYGKSALRSTIKEMSTPDLARMNAFDKEGNIKSSVSQDVSGFLNRIMVLPIDKQNAAFDKFYSKYKDNVEYAKQKGTFDTGVEKISGENIRSVGEPVILNEDKASGVKTEIITIEYEKKTHKETIRERRDNTSNLFEAKNKKSQRGYLYRVWDDGKVTVYGPRGAHGTIDKSEFLEKYEKATKEEVESSWSEEYKNIPEYDTIQTHLVTGSIFPVYNKIFYDQKQGRKIKRAVLADGRSFIGVEVKKAFIPKIKQNFGIGSDLYSAGSQEIIDLVNAGSIIEFDNGWKVSQRRVMGEDRIELDPGRTYVTAQQMEGMGLFNEIITSSKRYFIPTDTEKSIATMDNILKRAKPIRDLAAAQKTAMASAPLFERDVTKENQIYTPEFKRWFGDWENDPENASKVVDESGKPEIFYHGSDRKLEKIEPDYDEPGAWFTVLETAQNYAKGNDGRVHKAYLSVKKPMIVDFNSDMEPIVDGEVLDLDNNVDIVKYAQKRKYDGVHFKRGNFTEDAETWVVFNSDQIKLKAENKGTFKKNNPNIYASALPVPTFKITDLAKSVTPAPVKVNPVQTVKAAPSGKKLQYAQASNRLGNQISNEPKEVKDTNFLTPLEKIKTNWFEDVFPLQKIEDIHDKDLGVSRKGAREMDKAVDAVLGSPGATHRYIDENLTPILREGTKGAKSPGEVYVELNKYLIAKRASWLYDNNPNFVDIGINKDDANNYVEFIETGAHPHYDRIMKMANGIWQYEKELLKIKRDANVLGDVAIAELDEPYYVPFYRDMETIKDAGKTQAGGQRYYTLSTGIKKGIKGSLTGKKVIDPIQSIQLQTYETIINANRNKCTNALFKLAEESEEVKKYFTLIPDKWVKAGTIEYRMEADALLRPMLEDMAKNDYGLTVEYKTKLAARVKGRLEKVLGLYKDDTLKTLVGSTEGTFAHELGHAIYEKTSWYRDFISNNSTELNNVAATRYLNVPGIDKKFIDYTQTEEEKAAEFIAMYVIDREGLNKLAPKAMQEFGIKILADNTMKKLIGMQPSNVKGIYYKTVDNVVQLHQVPRDADVISGFVDGKITSYRVPVEIADAVKNMDVVAIPEFIRILFTPINKIVRAGAVAYNVDFLASNPARDVQESAFKGRTIPIYDFIRGAYEVATNGEYLKEWERNYGSMNHAEAGNKGYLRNRDELKYGNPVLKYLDPEFWNEYKLLKGSAKAVFDVFKSPLEAIRAMSGALEAATRVGTYRRARRALPKGMQWYSGKPMDIEDAIRVSRDTTNDFQRGGKYSKKMNSIIPFSNAAIRGMYTTYRYFRDDPKRALLGYFVYAIVPTLLQFLMAKDEEWYKAIKLKERLDNWIIPNPLRGREDLPKWLTGPYFTIPKGFWVQPVANPLQIALEKANGMLLKSNLTAYSQIIEDVDPYGISTPAIMMMNYMTSSYDNMPALKMLPVSIRMILDPALNYDFYWHKEIEAVWDKASSDRRQRYDKYTSESMKMIGKALNISPKMLQHEFELVGAGAGRNVLWLADYALGKRSDKGIDLDRVPIVRRFYGKIKEFSTDMDEDINLIDKQLRMMNDYKANFGKRKKNRDQLNKIEKSNTKVKELLYLKRSELVNAKARALELLKNQE